MLYCRRHCRDVPDDEYEKEDFMRKFFTGIAVGTFVAILAATPASAANECQSIKSIPKRVACVEKKADQAIAAAAAVDKKVAALPKGLTWADLKGVKVEWTDHPGVCLYFRDWNNNGSDEHTARSVLGCNAGNYVFTIRK
jgi:hypothetical protein